MAKPTLVQLMILLEMESGAFIVPKRNKRGQPTDAQLSSGGVVTRKTCDILLTSGWIRQSTVTGYMFISRKGRKLLAEEAESLDSVLSDW